MYRLSNIFDYYYMAAMQFEAGNALGGQWPNRAQEKFLEQLDNNMADLEFGLSETISNYLTLACFAETRHAYWHCSGYIQETVGESRRVAVGKSVSYEPENILVQSSKLFTEYNWARMYGGEKWAHLAQFALDYRHGHITRQFFIDHIVDLAHNNGFCFDKGSALDMAGLLSDVDDSMLKSFLDFKTFERSLLFTELDTGYYELLTTRTRLMVGKFFRLFFPNLEIPGEWRLARLDWPVYADVPWGSDMLAAPEWNKEMLCTCKVCGGKFHREACHEIGFGEYVCHDCYTELYWSCDWCNHKFLKAEARPTLIEECHDLCDECVQNFTKKCEVCGEVVLKMHTTDHDGVKMCNTCSWKKEQEKQVQYDKEQHRVYDSDVYQKPSKKLKQVKNLVAFNSDGTFTFDVFEVAAEDDEDLQF